MDYGSQVWSPICKSKLAKLETILKGYLSNSKDMGKNSYWENLRIAKMYSIQRRHERYKILYIWKIINGLCPNYGLKWSTNKRRGTLVDIPVLNSYVPNSVKTIRDQSLTVHGGKLFNSFHSSSETVRTVRKLSNLNSISSLKSYLTNLKARECILTLPVELPAENRIQLLTGSDI